MKMANFGKRSINRDQLRQMFTPDVGVGTGMELEEALGMVLELAREAVTQSEADHNENAEALGVVENLRFLIEKTEEVAQ
jgi:hypothetical protein